MKRMFRELWISNVGGVIVYIAFALPMLMGAMALSVDLGRSFILNTELKDFADAAALAGAFELDKTDDAMARAEDAARTGLKGTLVNIQAFATDGGGPSITVDKVVFLRNLPADGTDFTIADTATSDADAAFIFVSVVNRSVRSGLSRALGVIPDFNTTACSIAGRGNVICEVPAMFMCNPLEGDGTNGTELFPLDGTPCNITDLGKGAFLKEECLKGRQMKMRSGGGGNQDYTPGEFGLLECPGFAKGAPGVFECIAQARPQVCVSSRAFLKTGQVTVKVADAINIRFDIYPPGGGGNSYQNDPKYRPAVNVAKGYESNPGNGQNCSTKPKSGTLDLVAPLPRDSCLVPGSGCTLRWGSGDWQADGRFDEYWLRNHGNSAYPTPPAGSDTWTRYDVYRHEVNSELGLEAGPGIPNVPDSLEENGNACHYTGKDGVNLPPYDGYSDPSLNEDDLDRRLLTLTVVNCVEHADAMKGVSSNNSGGIEVEGYVEIFLTEPAFDPGGGSGGNGSAPQDIYGEVAKIVDNGDNRLKVIVQLYR